jgi:hypothetical protein
MSAHRDNYTECFRRALQLIARCSCKMEPLDSGQAICNQVSLRPVSTVHNESFLLPDLRTSVTKWYHYQPALLSAALVSLCCYDSLIAFFVSDAVLSWPDYIASSETTMSTSGGGNGGLESLPAVSTHPLGLSCRRLVDHIHVLSMESTLFFPGMQSRPALIFRDVHLPLLPAHCLTVFSSSEFNFFQFIATHYLKVFLSLFRVSP